MGREKPCISLNHDLGRLRDLKEMNMADYKFKEITEKIIGSSMRVHAALGNGFQEVIYQRALEIEMQEAGLYFEREMNMPIFYKGRQIGERRVDFFCRKKNNGRIKSNYST